VLRADGVVSGVLFGRTSNIATCGQASTRMHVAAVIGIAAAVTAAAAVAPDAPVAATDAAAAAAATVAGGAGSDGGGRGGGGWGGVGAGIKADGVGVILEVCLGGRCAGELR
jgi:hypothetical protein